MNRSYGQKLATTVILGGVVCFVASGAFATNRASEPQDSGQAEQSSGGKSAAARDHGQWRKLHRRMSKDDVKRLLGEPDRISVSRFYEAWEYGGGSVTFNGRGRLDSWSEP
jgi:hypothetical protein